MFFLTTTAEEKTPWLHHHCQHHTLFWAPSQDCAAFPSCSTGSPWTSWSGLWSSRGKSQWKSRLNLERNEPTWATLMFTIWIHGVRSSSLPILGFHIGPQALPHSVLRRLPGTGSITTFEHVAVLEHGLTISLTWGRVLCHSIYRDLELMNLYKQEIWIEYDAGRPSFASHGFLQKTPIPGASLSPSLWSRTPPSGHTSCSSVAGLLNP